MFRASAELIVVDALRLRAVLLLVEIQLSSVAHVVLAESAALFFLFILGHFLGEALDHFGSVVATRVRRFRRLFLWSLDDWRRVYHDLEHVQP